MDKEINTEKLLVQYVRDRKSNPVATLVAFKKPKSEKFIFGWSKYSVNKEDIPFSKDLGKKLAYELGVSNTILFIPDSALSKITSRKNNLKTHYRYIPRDIEEQAYSFLERALKYFKCEVKNVKYLTTEARANL